MSALHQILTLDGTFCTPILLKPNGSGTYDPFSQQVTIHVPWITYLDGIPEIESLPVAYALVIGEDASVYEEILLMFKRCVFEVTKTQISPEKVLVDFDKAALKALRGILHSNVDLSL